MTTRHSRLIRILPALIILALLIAVPVFAQPRTVRDISWNTSNSTTMPVSRFINSAYGAPLAPSGGIVGNGTPGSCTEAALDAVIAGGGIITFNCGPTPITITVTSEKAIIVNTRLDGGSLVSLSGGGTTRVFNVNAGATLDLANVTIRDGNANGLAGGGLLNNGTTTINDVGFINNTASVGGGIANYSVLTVTNGLFFGNAAHPDQGYTGGGGIVNGLPNSAIGLLTVVQSTFSDNTSDFTGGGIQNFGSAAVVDSTFNGNNAVYQFGGGITNYGYLTLSGSTFTNNTAGINGGAIDTIVALTVTQSSFVNNNAVYRGGAINNFLGSIRVSQSTFSGNFGGAYGGGLANDAGAATVIASTFNTNRTDGVGGALANNDSLLTIINSTFSGNSSITNAAGSPGNGGGLSNRGTASAVTIINSTFANNTATNYGGNLWAENAVISLQNTLVTGGVPTNCFGALTSQGHNLDSGNTCSFTATGDLVNVDPLFGPLQNNGGATLTHALLPGSPAINAGDNANCPATDQRGVKRPGGPACDIGAYEFNLEHSLFLPLVTGNISAVPDLIVRSLKASSIAVTVTISNIGSAPVVDEFWVDLYVDPHPAPTGANQVWNDGRSTQGVAWGITAPALPMQPGDVLTLTLNSPYYWAAFSHLVDIAPDTPVYAQVDSANTNTSHGGVLETHEIIEGPYNNILGPVLSSSSAAGQTPLTLEDQQLSRLHLLPSRPGR